MQRVDVDVNGRTLHVYNVHLGTAILERRHQAQRLATIVSDRHVTGPKIVLGDFNEWMRGLTTTLLSARLKSVDLQKYMRGAGLTRGCSRSCTSTTSTTTAPLEIVHIEVLRNRLSLVASDHLPLMADIRI